MKIDLHSHSTCSDGTMSPAALVDFAKMQGIDLFALTDHDTVSGLLEAKQQADLLGIGLVRGVEISCTHEIVGGYGKNQLTKKIIHVVALDFDNVALMDEKLQAIQNSREQRGQRIIEKLSEILSVDFDELWQVVLTKSGGNPKAVGRAHIAQVLHDKGFVRTVQDAFDKYLADGKSAYVAIETLSMAQTIELIGQCGGFSVLAHPTRYGLSATRVRRLIADFAMLGGQAVELPNSEPLSTRAMIDRQVAQHQLLVSVGSDFHGANMPWRKLGHTALPNAEQVGIWQKFRHVN